MNDQTLNVRVGQNVVASLRSVAQTMKALDRGETPAPHFEIGFTDVAQMFAVFTPRRWELIAALRKGGPMTIAALAKLLKRDYKNVHSDVVALQEWLAVEKDEAGLVYAPFTDIHVDVHLPENTDSSKDEAFTHA